MALGDDSRTDGVNFRFGVTPDRSRHCSKTSADTVSGMVERA
jgi:hypothetical protein